MATAFENVQEKLSPFTTRFRQALVDNNTAEVRKIRDELRKVRNEEYLKLKEERSAYKEYKENILVMTRRWNENKRTRTRRIRTEQPTPGLEISQVPAPTNETPTE